MWERRWIQKPCVWRYFGQGCTTEVKALGDVWAGGLALFGSRLRHKTEDFNCHVSELKWENRNGLGLRPTDHELLSTAAQRYQGSSWQIASVPKSWKETSYLSRMRLPSLTKESYALLLPGIISLVLLTSYSLKWGPTNSQTFVENNNLQRTYLTLDSCRAGS